MIDRVLSRSSESHQENRNTNTSATSDSLMLKQAVCRLVNVTDLRYQRAQLSVIWKAGQNMGLLLQKMPLDERIVVEELKKGLCIGGDRS